jgi:hypothetical protein
MLFVDFAEPQAKNGCIDAMEFQTAQYYSRFHFNAGLYSTVFKSGGTVAVIGVVSPGRIAAAGIVFAFRD